MFIFVLSVILIKQNVAVAIDFNHIFKFSVRDYVDCCAQHGSKLYFDTQTSFLIEIKMVLLCQVRSEVKGVESVFREVISSRYFVSLVVFAVYWFQKTRSCMTQRTDVRQSLVLEALYVAVEGPCRV